MSILFCDGWFRAKKRPGRLWSESQALAAHQSRKLHTIVVEEQGRSWCFVELNMQYVGVGFLDRHLREYLSYQFDEVEPGRLFLTMSCHRQYQGETDEITRAEVWYFDPDGKVVVHEQDMATKQVFAKEFEADLSGNWEPYPEFGKYKGVTQIERASGLLKSL